jgi:hypothetical protein
MLTDMSCPRWIHISEARLIQLSATPVAPARTLSRLILFAVVAVLIWLFTCPAYPLMAGDTGPGGITGDSSPWFSVEDAPDDQPPARGHGPGQRSSGEEDGPGSRI